MNCLDEKSKEYEYVIANLNIENQLTPVTQVGIADDNNICSLNVSPFILTLS